MTEPAPQPAAAPQPPLTAAEDKQWASFAHFGGVLGFIPPLIIWLVFKDRGTLTNQEGKESLNFQITVVIGWVALIIISTILTAVTFGIFLAIAWILYLALFAVQVIFSIMGGVKVNAGGTYRYPFALRLIK